MVTPFVSTQLSRDILRAVIERHTHIQCISSSKSRGFNKTRPDSCFHASAIFVVLQKPMFQGMWSFYEVNCQLPKSNYTLWLKLSQEISDCTCEVHCSEKCYPCNGYCIMCMTCEVKIFGGTLPSTPSHQILTPVHNKTEVGILLYMLPHLWRQINPARFHSPMIAKYYNVFMWNRIFWVQLNWMAVRSVRMAAEQMPLFQYSTLDIFILKKKINTIFVLFCWHQINVTSYK